MSKLQDAIAASPTVRDAIDKSIDAIQDAAMAFMGDPHDFSAECPCRTCEAYRVANGMTPLFGPHT